MKGAPDTLRLGKGLDQGPQVEIETKEYRAMDLLLIYYRPLGQAMAHRPCVHVFGSNRRGV